MQTLRLVRCGQPLPPRQLSMANVIATAKPTPMIDKPETIDASHELSAHFDPQPVSKGAYPLTPHWNLVRG